MNYNVKVLHCLMNELQAVCQVRPSDMLVHTMCSRPIVANPANQSTNILLLACITFQLQTRK